MVRHVSRLERLGVLILVTMGIISVVFLWLRNRDLEAMQVNQEKIIRSISRLSAENDERSVENVKSMRDRAGLHDAVKKLEAKHK